MQSERNGGTKKGPETEDDRMLREILEEAISETDESLTKAKEALAKGNLDMAAAMFGITGIAMNSHARDLKTAMESRDLKKKRTRRERRNSAGRN